MGKKFSIPRSTKVKPKFTVKDFQRGVYYFEQRMAMMFYDFVIDKCETKEYDFTLIQDAFGTGEDVTNEDVINSLDVNKKFVFVKEGKFIDELSHKEFMSMLEYGRKDKGILPQPLLRQCFEEFAPTYKKELKNFLLNKK